MEEDLLKRLGESIIESSQDIKTEELSDVFLPLQMELKINLKKIQNDNIKISLFLLEALIAKIMGGIVEKAIFGEKEEDKAKLYNELFSKHLNLIGKALISKDENQIFEEIKLAILNAGKEGLIKI